ncbi:IS21 family transposase [Dysgonomonas sp. GY75]|jgi:transposase|uniref:IS21 family transposase n=1 Tax=Dysgonomonas sp. GY75 TaxID=2780419 RepID=UPI001883AC8B|nr:IS21 family transposase [Dysgonomonas sp. GY75]MBF0647954.1 IS21 family transposase [Dysgonomonas sp. GY75]
MAGKPTRMSKIKQLLRLHQQGVSNRGIGRELGLYKATVNSYIDKLKLHGYDIDQLLELEDPVLETKFIAGTAAYTQDKFTVFREQIPYFEKELGRAHVTRKLLWDEYKLNHPDGYSYPQFCYHLKQLKVARHPVAILDHHAAEKLYVDFAGDTMSYIDRETGEVLKAHIFVACLPYSDYTFTMAVSSQTTEDFLYALSSALRHLGGSAKILTPDNLKAAVIKSDRYEPDLNRLMEDFANHYGFVVIPARSRHPRDKAAVENQVKIIYRRVYAKLRDTVFLSLAELNHALLEKTMEHNQTRMQQKPYTRQEKFLAEEKNMLIALPKADFEVKYYTQLRVANNNCIYLGRDKHYYSVPYCHIGKKVQVIYTRTLVQIFCEGACVATHRRAAGYGYTTLREHLCSTHRHYKDRSPDYYITKAKERSHMLGLLVEKNFEQNLIPEMIYRRCDGLLSLQRKTDPVIFDKACRFALDNNMLSCKSLIRIIDNKTYIQHELEFKELPRHLNIRGKNYYY